VRPRTGIAHDRHIARPHSSQVATDGVEPWTLHRSGERPRSSVGTGEAYRRGVARPRVDGGARAVTVRAVGQARLAVLASGNGTNLQALLDDPVVGSWVALVVSDRADAFALDRARARGVEAVFVDPRGHADRVAFDRALLGLLRARAIDVVALAGYLRIVGQELVGAFEGRMLNVHPALLPAFPGTTSIADALAWGAKVTGVTVHLVDAEVDHGPIVDQEALRVLPDDDARSLASRIHEIEHRLLPAAVRALGEGRIVLDGRRVRVLHPEAVVGEART
jgi:phosphoribosylglycinamide formyltransferase-1